MAAVNPGPAMVLFDSSGGLTPFYADVEAEFTLHNTAGRWTVCRRECSARPADIHPSLDDVRVTREGRTPGKSIPATAVGWSSLKRSLSNSQYVVYFMLICFFIL